MPHRIPWAKPYIGDEEVQGVTATLRAARLSMGAEVRAFEQEVRPSVTAGTRSPSATARSPWTWRSTLAGVGPGDEVLVSALSYIATTNCIVRAGATPVFCDVDPITLNLEPEDAAARITPRTRVLLVADYCGSSLDHGRLGALCADHGLTMVLDGAQSMGTMFNGPPGALLRRDRHHELPHRQSIPVRGGWDGHDRR